MAETSSGDTRPKLLIVDDDHELCSMLAEYLGPEGFATETVGTGPQALDRLVRGPVDLMVLDVMLPELSGFEVLRRIRATSRMPVIMLTARGEEVDRVVGLEMGADDYLAKPFSPRELVARIRAVLRRMSGDGQQTNGILAWGPLRLDLRARRADVNEHDLELTAAELRILELLVRADTKTVTRDELMTQALGRRLLPTDRSLDTHVSNLRAQADESHGPRDGAECARYRLRPGSGVVPGGRGARRGAIATLMPPAESPPCTLCTGGFS